MDKNIFNIDAIEYVFKASINEKENQKVILSAKDNSKILWKTIFENTIIEEVKSLYKINNKLFCIINNSINKIDINNGKIIKKEYFGNTPIIKIIADEDNLYILLYYYEFDQEKYLSNVLCINNKLEIKWFAELPMKNDIYTNLNEIGNNIIGNTWDCWECIINKNNGKIIEKRFTK